MHKLFFLSIAAILLSFKGLTAQTLAKNYKEVGNANPLSPCVFCADPTALVYDGRVYVYGTNDHQQFIHNGKSGSNGYGNISSLVVFSTDDMVNWRFHGTIDVAKICSSWGWRFSASWAPSVTWRTNSSGNDEFFLYFANSGGSIGVLKASSPIGPWRSPLTKPMIDADTPGVRPCAWIFDPGVVVDDEGNGWIAFGGGDPQPTGSKLMPGNSRFAKLKSSMTSIDGSAVNLPAPYLFEASELNMMNGRFVYTYNTSWSDRDDWTRYAKRGSNAAPSSCSMCYMVSDNPLDPDAWEYRGEYVPNEGNFGMGWGNNHTHLQKYEGKYYLFYHSTLLESSMQTGASGFRSIGVDKVVVNESTQKINKVTMTKTGVTAIRNLNPYELQQMETMATSGGISYENFTNITKTSYSNLGNDACRNLLVKMAAGSWTLVRNVDFGQNGASQFTLHAKGSGTLEIRLISRSTKPSASVEFSSTGVEETTIDLDPEKFKGVKNVYFVVTSSTNANIDSWQFTEAASTDIQTPASSFQPSGTSSFYDLSGRRLPSAGASGTIVIERYVDQQGVVHTRKRM
jgi:arabinoxylan arabinofuranohydrolase